MLCSLFSLVYSLQQGALKGLVLVLVLALALSPSLQHHTHTVSICTSFSPFLQDAYAKDLEESSTLAASLKSSLETITKEAATAAAKVAELEVRNKKGTCYFLAFI